jgi:hypothetical protein
MGCAVTAHYTIGTKGDLIYMEGRNDDGPMLFEATFSPDEAEDIANTLIEKVQILRRRVEREHA